MKKNSFVAVFATLMGLLMFSSVSADTGTFNVSLGRNSTQKAEVLKLQQFLFDNGYLSVRPTGAFLSLTLKAVAAFQKSQGIETTGYFGPLSRAAANKKFVGKTPAPAANISVQSVTNSDGSGATAVLATQKTIKWQASGYPQDAGVNINLLRKTSNSPESFSLIRTVVRDTPNDGEEKWVPQNGETGSDIYVEVTCSNTYHFTAGCQAGKPIKIN